MKIRPVDNKVVLKRLEADEKTKAGIYLPEKAKEKPTRGEVLAVGPGKLLDTGKRAAMQLRKGDCIIIGKWGGTEVKVEDDDLLIIAEDEVLAVIE